MMKPRVKICCIQDWQEAQLAIKHGASALGLVSRMPSGPGIINDTIIQEIASQIPPPISSFLLTSEVSADKIIAHHQHTQTSTIQIVDQLQSGTYQQLRTALPGIKIVQVIHVIDEQAIEEAVALADEVDAILLDSGNPHAAVKTLGGTGNTHNWEISRAIREAISIPLFLAGGLHAGNVRQAVQQVQPFGVDLCSGVRTNGKLDEQKLQAFFEAIS